MPTHPLPANVGHVIQGNRSYIVRWQEGGYWHQRYFYQSPDAVTFLEYSRQFDPNAYVASLGPKPAEKGSALRLWDLHIRRCPDCTAAKSLNDLCLTGRPLFQDALEENLSIEELLERRA